MVHADGAARGDRRPDEPSATAEAADAAGRRPSPYPAPTDTLNPPRAARHLRARPLRRQGRRRQHRPVGRRRREDAHREARVHWLTKLITPRPVRELVPEAGDLEIEVYSLPNLGASTSLVPRPARAGRGRVDPVRPPGQGPGRVAPLADRPHPGRPAARQRRYVRSPPMTATEERDALREVAAEFVRARGRAAPPGLGGRRRDAARAARRRRPSRACSASPSPRRSAAAAARCSTPSPCRRRCSRPAPPAG